MEANKLLIFPDLDAAGSRNRRTNHSFFFNLFADLTSAEVIQAQGWRTIDASLHVLFARLISASRGRLQAGEQLSRLRMFCSPGVSPRAWADYRLANNCHGQGCFVRPAHLRGPRCTSAGWGKACLRPPCIFQNPRQGLQLPPDVP